MIRRVAQFVEDLETLGLITPDQVRSQSSICGKLTVLISVSKSDPCKYFFIRDLFKDEFSIAIQFIEDSEVLQIIF